MPTQVEHRPLSEVSDLASGVTLGRTLPESSGIELPYLRVANVQDGFINTDDIKTIRVSSSEIERFQLHSGDVLLTEGGDFDKLGRGAVWDGRIDPCLHQNHVFRVRCNQELLIPGFLALYLSSQDARRHFLGIAKQTTNLATISSSQLKKMRVPCPPIHEQLRITEFIEAVTETEESIKASIAKLLLFEQAMCNQLLTPDSTWTHGSIGDLGLVVTGNTPPPTWESQSHQGVSFLTPRELTEDGHVVRHSRLISNKYRSQVRELPPQSTLAVCIGFSLGKVSLCSSAACTNQQINAVVPHEAMDPRFVFLSVSRAMDAARRRMSLQTTPIINKSDFSRLPCPMPNREDQQRIATRVWAAREEQIQLRAELAKVRKMRQGLADDLLSGRVSVRNLA
jgi:restriction endonuclease S subunit